MFLPRSATPPTNRALLSALLQVLAYEANIEAAVLAQDAGTTPLPEDYAQFIPKVNMCMLLGGFTSGLMSMKITTPLPVAQQQCLIR